MKKMNKKGFSLVELIVVIAIMAVLVGVLAPALMSNVEKSRAQKDVSAMSEVTNSVELALADESIYDEVANILGTATSGTIEFAPNAGVISISDLQLTPASGSAAAVAKLTAELQQQIGESVTLSSKTYKGSTYTVTITMEAGKAVKVEGAFAG